MNIKDKSCYYENVTGLNSKMFIFSSSRPLELLPDIPDTWLSENISNCELFPGNEYDIYRKTEFDHTIKIRGGGELFDVRNKLKSKIWSIFYIESDFQKFYVIVINLSDKTILSENKRFFENTEQVEYLYINIYIIIYPIN